MSLRLFIRRFATLSYSTGVWQSQSGRPALKRLVETDMKSSQTSTPVFGSANPAIECKLRRAAYAVITDSKGRVAVVRAGGKYFLPGGGSLHGETPEQTLLREALEELARSVRIVRKIGEAVQYFRAEGEHYRMEAIFFAAEFTSEEKGAGEHELYWLETDKIEEAFYHQCHAWACLQS